MVQQWRRNGQKKHYNCWWNSGREIVEQWRSDRGTVEHLMVEQRKKDGGTEAHLVLERWNRDGGTVKHLMVEK